MTYDYGTGRIHPDEFWSEKGLRDLGYAMDNLGQVVGLSANQRAKMNYLAHSLPVVGDFLNAKDEWNKMSDYLSNRGMQWSDLKYSGMSNNAYRGVSTGYHFVSDNVKSLYAEDDLEYIRKRRDYLAYHESYARGMGFRDGYYGVGKW